MDEREIDLIFDNDYFKLNKKLQILTGLWPYKSGKFKLTARIVMYVLLFIVMIPLTNGCRVWCGTDIDICSENVVGITYVALIFLKYWVTIQSEDKLKNVYKQVAKNWLEITNPQEHEILEDYAKQGKIKSIVYMVYMVISGISFCQIPMISIILDVIIPLNESRPRVLFVRGEFIIDPYKNFYKLYIYFIVVSIITINIITAINTTYILIIHQILGLFKIVKHRIRMSTLPFYSKKDESYCIIVKAICLHKDALQFIDLIETSYSFSFLILIGFTMISISIGTFVIITHTSKMLNLIRISMIVIGASLHYLFISWSGQLIIDHSYELFLSVYANEWYNLTKRSKTLIQIIMMRCSKSCTFTAGGLYIINLENFGSIMETALSYIAILVSLRL